ncbi:hypothetical protein S40285_08453 [Stachybotrys chlorohalonatus IBT 40285]|uniref:Glycoside hydrolase 131 catalytic N-terminal domain-containing protein n=1 Tax=Stachybotrys chlorohalonatus (strain IBT 40285) TaxID=1283841 RepID=A0A084QYJ5_STAC4|nr:hypothetical protein S40285_08453 [Stachybotrys chlorohalonata IBT 40285]
MAPSLFRILPVLAGVTAVAGQSCSLQFDGRIPRNFTVADFDTQNGIYNPDFVKGRDLAFSDIIELETDTTLFDTNSVPFTVQIDDSSIFAPSADNVQTGFRRVELLPASNSGTDDSTLGIKTLHFSVAKDITRPLNLSHEYQLVFLESADYSNSQFDIKTGTILGRDTPDPDTIQVYGNINAGAALLYSTPFTEGVIHNFALRLDYETGTTQIFYSQDQAQLQSVTDILANDLSGQGQYHIGLLKKPTGSDGDITREGFQSSGINEAVLYGGIFLEDSADGCLSLGPSCPSRARRSRFGRNI